MNHENMKMTEVGWIPKDWECKPLSIVGDVKMCKRIMKYQTNDSGDIPFFKIGTFGGKPDAFICRSLFEQYKAKYNYPAKGDILISAAGTVGRTVIFDGKDSYFQDSNIVWLNNDESRVVNPYLLQYFQIIKWETENGGIVTRLYNDNLKSTYFSFPPISEQRRIAEVLSDTDSLISSLSRTIEKKRLVKQGAMQQLLTGKTRLKGFSGEWVEKELGEVCKIQRGSILKSSDYCYGPIPVIAGGMTPAGYHNVANREGRTITISASGANAGYVSIHNGKIFASDCSTISESNEYNIDFIYQFLLVIQQEIYRAQTGGAQPHIHPKDVAPIKIKMPDYNEQFAISERLRTMDNEIASLEAELQKYKALKQGMMQKLLTGQIRLK